MQIMLLAVGTRMPGWVGNAFDEYAGRMPRSCTLGLREIPARKRGKNADIPRILGEEARDLARAVPNGSLKISLDRKGRTLTTRELSDRLQGWIDESRDVALLVGGPEGLSEEVLRESDHVWSLSALTFAHPLVRVIIAEQLYRAWSICAGLPYHRGD